MRNSEYWQKRFKFLEEARHKAGAEVYKEIEDQYKRAQREIEAEIDKWYRRFAENNQISLREAKRLLSGDELEEFQWDVQEYIRHGEENAISGEWAKELENASSRFHVSRLQALKTNIRQSIEALYGQQQSLVSEFLGETYKSDYYHTAFELMKGFEIGFDIGKVNEDYLQKVLFKPWAPDGRNFSDRIWENKEKLVNTLHKELTQSIMTGADPQKAIDAIAHDMNVSKANAGRLVMTESAYFGSLAHKDCFIKLGVEEYEIVATLDDKTSEICQEMDGKHFPTKDFEPGVTADPFHVNCRSTTCPYFNDEFSLGERAARDENGEVYYVPADTKYPEWKEAFVDGGSKEEFVMLEDYAKPPEPPELGVTVEKKTIEYDPKKPYIVAEWEEVENSTGTVTELSEYTVNGVTYKVHGKEVVVDPLEEERELANILATKYGKKVELVPKVSTPQGVKTPDYLINGERYDLKSPKGKGKDVIRDAIKKNYHQAHKFIIDVTRCPLSMEEVEKQIEIVFVARNTRFVEEIVLTKDGKVIKDFIKNL